MHYLHEGALKRKPSRFSVSLHEGTEQKRSWFKNGSYKKHKHETTLHM